MQVEGFEFPQSALEYLVHRKGIPVTDEKTLELACQAQIRRSRKQAAVLFTWVNRVTFKSVLDIGCGLGLIDVLLVQHFPTIKAVHLLDGSEASAIWTGFKKDGQPWNNARVAFEMLKANCRQEDKIDKVTYPANPELTIPVDLIVSFKSWGVHYPISTYVGLVRRSLQRGGMIATHIDEPGGLQCLQDAGFNLLAKVGNRLHLLTKKD